MTVTQLFLTQYAWDRLPALRDSSETLLPSCVFQEQVVRIQAESGQDRRVQILY
jgi:hypothetical protein